MSNSIYDPQYPEPYVIGGHPTEPPRHVLGVSEIVALAQAGVKMDFKEIMHQVRPDPPSRRETVYDCSVMLGPLLDRMRMAETAAQASKHPGMEPGRLYNGPAHMSVCAHNGKVFVFVQQYGADPVIIEDDIHLYPSDALLAKIGLLQQLQPKDTAEDCNAMPQTAQASPINRLYHKR